ncbi:MAG: glycosyltransferase family 2 protein, partial [Bacteroidota bacterium]
PLVIWGAGQKGKKIARLLSKLNIEFKWVCDNHKKIGKHIYDVELEHFSLIKNLQGPQVIVAVANAKEQQEIIEFFEVLNMKSKQDYFFFC